MDEIRSWWEVPSIAHFCSLFRTAFDLTDFDIEDLEDALEETEKEEGSAFLLDLIFRLLNGCYARKDITVANYDLYVKDIIKFKWGSSDNPIKEKSEFKELTLREKVEFIYAVCEYRLDTEDVSDVIKGFDGDSMRVEPLGKDKDGALYWYFYGSRLYMEDPEPKKSLTKEDKRALDREKRVEAKKKKQGAKRQRKEEKKKLSALKKNEKKKQLEQAARNQKEDTNTRRSGRLRNKKIVVEESDSSESSSSSSEEEELEDSSSEENEEEEIVEKTPARGRGKAKRTPAKSIGKKTNKKTPAKKETPKPTRSSARKPKTTKKMEESKALQPERCSRRSSSSRNKLEPPPTPSAYDSETEEENDFDVDSGHESAGSVRSETSKISQRLNEAGRRTSRRPTVNVDLKRDLSNTNDEDDFNDDENSKGANFIMDDAGNDSEKDAVKAENDDETVGEKENHDQTVDDQSMEAETKEKPASSEDNGVKEEDMNENGNNSNDVNHENETEEMNQETICKTSESSEKDVPLVEDVQTPSVKDDNASTDHVENNDRQSIENENDSIDKTDALDRSVDQKMTLDTKNDAEESEASHVDIPDSKGDLDKSFGNEPEEAKVDADANSGDTKVKTESNDNEDLNDCPSNDASNDTIPDVKSENEPMDVDNDENSRYSRRGTRRSLKSESVEMKKEKMEENEANKKKDVDKFTLEKPAVAPAPSKSITRWHLVCETLDDWVNLAEWFNESAVRCEKALSKEIRENFLPVLPEIIDAREKEKTRKLMQEQELRRSNRLTLKQRERLEQEKILAEALAEEEKARIQGEEEKRLKEEHLRLEEENRQREERRRAREERAARLSMREERSRLLAEGKEIPPELIYTATQKYKDEDHDSDDSRCDLKDEEDYGALMKVINAMKYHKDCWPFLEPVTDEVAPGYSDIIKRPMDLSKIEEKVEKRDYRSRQHFLSDFRLMFNNCKRYNGQDSDFSDCARSMEQMLKKYMKRFVTDEPTDKYYEDEDFMVAGGKGRVHVGEKRYRPKRAASSKAIETVHRALNSSEEESSSDEDDRIQVKRRREPNANQSPFKVQSHHDLLLQELKRQREKKLAASALQNHKVITRGPERIRVPNPAGGVMIIPKSEMNSSGVLRMAATREIKRKVNPQFAQKGQVVHTINPAKKDLGLNIIDQTTPGSSQPKTIRIVASSGTGQGSVKQTAENVKVSADGYLIISGKNSGIKVTENTKIVIQPPGAQPQGGAGGQSPAAQSPVTIGGNTPDFSQLAGGSKISTPRPNPGLSGLTSAQASSETSFHASMPVTGQQVSLSNLLRQATSSHVLSTLDQSRLQALVKQLASEGATTPEKAKTIDIARKILQLNLQKRKMLQQRTDTTDVNSPKVAKLESHTNEGAGSSSIIEERLRDPNVNIDSQLGSVSKNVISNVNIASDILDTYYSVMNEAKTKTSVGSTPVTKPSVTVTRAVSVTPVTSAAISSPDCQSSVSGTAEPVTSSTIASSSSKPTASHGSISDMTRLIINLMNKSDSGGINSAIQRSTASSVNTALTQSGIDTEKALTQDTIPATVVNSSLDSGNLVTNTFPAIKASSLSGITSSSSVSDLLRSANIQHTNPTTNNDVGPIEALLLSNSSVASNPVSVSKFTCSLPGSDVNQISDQSVVTSPPPGKNERPNLFDSFEKRAPCSKQSVSTNEFNSISNSDEKTIRMKLRADKMPLPSSSTINFGSPLKTSSVLEALKCKLHTLKPDIQSYETSDATTHNTEETDPCEHSQNLQMDGNSAYVS